MSYFQATNTAAARLVQQHRRVFSHGHITFGGQEVLEENSGQKSSPVKSSEEMPPRRFVFIKTAKMIMLILELRLS